MTEEIEVHSSSGNIFADLELPNPDELLIKAELAEAIEDYCLNNALDEANNTPLLNREDALAYLEES